MKRFLLLFGFGFILAALTAQVPETIRYQAVIRDPSGNPLAGHNVSLKIRILADVVTETEVFSETHQVETNDQGLVSLEIGNGNILNGDLGNIDWAGYSYFLEISLDATGGNDYTLLGTSQLLSVPYALLARNAVNTDDADADPENELQELVLNENFLSISRGNEVELPSVWATIPGGIGYTAGKVLIGNETGITQLELQDDFEAGGRNLLIGDDAYLTDIDRLNTLGIFGGEDSTRVSVQLGSDGTWITGKDSMLGIGTNEPQALLDVSVMNDFPVPGLHIRMPDYDRQTQNHIALTVSSEWASESRPRADIFRLYDEETSPVMELLNPAYNYLTALSPGSLYLRGENGNTVNLNWEEGLILGTSTSGYNLMVNSAYPLYYRKYGGTWTDRVKIDENGNAYFAGNLQVDGILTGSIEIDTVHVSQITGLLGQNYTLNFPDILDNLAEMEISGIALTDKVVMISSIGHETERITTPNQYSGSGELTYHEEPGLTMEFPLIFETLNENDATVLRAWFDEASPQTRDIIIIYRNLAETETSRWLCYSYLPESYEEGTEGRTRFTLKHNSLPDNVAGCFWDGMLGGEHSYNPETDKLVEIEGIPAGTWFTPAVEVDLEERTVTLTCDYNEGADISAWVYNTVIGNDHDRAMSLIETTDGTPGTEIMRYNHYECIPIRYEHIYGFGLNAKLKVRIVIAYGWREQG
ncbi:MAG: hypothetical protein ACP5D1_08610 [Bacteroidales bacterium]